MSEKTEKKQDQVDLLTLPMEQLVQLQQSWNYDLKQLTSALQQLHAAQDRFKESQNALKLVSEQKEGTEGLIPLTGALFLPGVIGNVDDVLVDIGTGYFVQKDSKGAIDVLQRRIDAVVENMETIQQAIQEKQAFVQLCGRAIKAKQQTQQFVQQRLASQQTPASI